MQLNTSTLTGMLCLALLLGACEKTVNSLDELDAYYRATDSPYVQTVVRDGIKVTARHIPTEAMLIPMLKRYEEMRARLSTDTSRSLSTRDSLLVAEQTRLDEQRQLYDRSLYFALTIGFEDGQRDIVYQGMEAGFGNYSDWLQKLLFQLKEQIFLRTASGDEIPLDTYHMERSYGMTRDRTLLLMFPAMVNERVVWGDKSSPLEIVVKEFGLKTGRMKFRFKHPGVESQYKLLKTL